MNRKGDIPVKYCWHCFTLMHIARKRCPDCNVAAPYKAEIIAKREAKARLEFGEIGDTE